MRATPKAWRRTHQMLTESRRGETLAMAALKSRSSMPQGLPHVKPTRPYDHSGLTLLSGSYGQMLPFSMEQPCGTLNRRFSSRSSRQDLMTSGQSPPVAEAQSAAAYTASIHPLSILRVIRGDWTIPVRLATRGWKGL